MLSLYGCLLVLSAGCYPAIPNEPLLYVSGTSVITRQADSAHLLKSAIILLNNRKSTVPLIGHYYSSNVHVLVKQQHAQYKGSVPPC